MSDERRRAAELLGLSEDARPASVRAELLRRLPVDEFLPAPSVLRACGVLTGQRLAGALESDAEDENRWRERVEDFAADFFALPPTDRARRWQALRHDVSPYPALVARLELLKPGLELETIPDTDGRAGQLAQEIARLFVLRPAERARRRRELLAQWRKDASAWAQTAARFSLDHPQMAALEEELPRRLCSALADEAKVKEARRRPPPAPVQPPSTAPTRGLTLAGVLIVVFLLRMFASLGSHTERPAPPAPNVWQLDREKQNEEMLRQIIKENGAKKVPNDQVPPIPLDDKAKVITDVPQRPKADAP